MSAQVINIKRFLKEKVKICFLLTSILLLSACGSSEADSCDTMASNASACPLCTVYNMISGVASSLANAAWGRLDGSLADVVLVVAAIYIAVFTLKMVGSFGKQSVGEYLSGDKNGLFLFMFKATVIYSLLKGHDFQSLVVFPLLSGSAEIGGKLSAATGLSFSLGDGSSWKAIFDMLSTTARKFNDSVMFVVGIGEGFMCHAVSGEGHSNIFEWDILMLLYGIIVFIFGWILLAGVSFYLVDIMIRLTFAAALMPVGIACAISGLSMPYAKSIWNLFLNVFFNIIMMGIVLGIVIKLVTSCVGGGPSPNLAGYSVDIAGLVAGNEVKPLSEAMVNFGHLVLIVVCFCIMLELVEQMGHLAEEISDTAGFGEALSPASQAATPIIKNVEKQGMKAAKWAGNTAIVEPTKYTGHVLMRATHMDVLFKRVSNKVEEVRGKYTGTGRQGYRAWWRK